MWRSKLIPAAIIVSMLVYLLSYIYEVPDVVCKYCGFEPCNPHKVVQRVSLFVVVWLFAYNGSRQLLNLIICSIMAALICNELVKGNQDWRTGIWVGFIFSVLFPFYEYKKHKK